MAAPLSGPRRTARQAGLAEPPNGSPNGAEASGLDFVHFNGMSGELYYPEIMAPGVALLDYDNDGDLDVYVVQGQMLGAQAVCARPRSRRSGPLEDRLFRNDLVVNADGTRTLHFTDVTDASGIDIRPTAWASRPATSTTTGASISTARASTAASCSATTATAPSPTSRGRAGTENRGGWGVSASFVDYDRDGWLDLFVGNYLIYSLESDVHCLSVTGQRDYCPPNSYRAAAEPSVSQPRERHVRGRHGRALVGGAYGPALGVSTADFNGDGWIDIYVANDGEPNQLWINQHNGTFKETAHLAGVAVNGAGNAKPSMGVDAGDFDNDGDEDLFVTNWLSQMNTLYVNDGTGNFEDRKAASGLGRAEPGQDRFRHRLVRLRQRRLARSAGGQRRRRDHRGAGAGEGSLSAPHDATSCTEISATGVSRTCRARAGAVFKLAEVGRGAAFGDIDNDGDIDVVVGNAAGRLRLLVNNVGNRNHWLGSAAGRRASTPRDMLGARVEIIRADGSRRCGAARDPTAATRRPTIRVCSWVSARRLKRRACASSGRAAARRNGLRFRSIDTPR